MLSRLDPVLQNEDIFSGPALDQEDPCDRCQGDGVIEDPDGLVPCDWCFGEG